MDESTEDTRQRIADIPVTKRREEVANLAVQLRQEARSLQELLQRLDAAEAVAHLTVPRSFRGQCGGWLAADRETTESADVDPHVQAFLEDLNTYAALHGMRGALQTLMANNRRFGMVLDLILAAMPLVEAATHDMARECVSTHVRQCQAVQQQLHILLHEFPRFRGPGVPRFGGPVA